MRPSACGVVERVAPPISLLCLVANDVGQRGFRNLAREFPAQSRMLEQKPCTVTSAHFMRRSIISIAMLGNGLLRACPLVPRQTAAIAASPTQIRTRNWGTNMQAGRYPAEYQ